MSLTIYKLTNKNEQTNNKLSHPDHYFLDGYSNRTTQWSWVCVGIMCLHYLLAWNTQQFHKIITIPVEPQLYQLNEFMYTFLQCSILSVHHKIQINTNLPADDAHSVLIFGWPNIKSLIHQFSVTSFPLVQVRDLLQLIHLNLQCWTSILLQME